MSQPFRGWKSDEAFSKGAAWGMESDRAMDSGDQEAMEVAGDLMEAFNRLAAYLDEREQPTEEES